MVLEIKSNEKVDKRKQFDNLSLLYNVASKKYKNAFLIIRYFVYIEYLTWNYTAYNFKFLFSHSTRSI